MEDFETTTVRANAFAALFVNGLDVSGRFLEELMGLGVNPTRLRPTYDAHVWRRAIDVARRHVYPSFEEDAAYWQLGRTFADGFYRNTVGKMVALTAGILGIERMIDRIPKYLALSTGKVKARLHAVGNRERLIFFEEAAANPCFMAGVLDGGLERSGAAPRVSIEDRTEHSYLIRIRW